MKRQLNFLRLILFLTVFLGTLLILNKSLSSDTRNSLLQSYSSRLVSACQGTQNSIPCYEQNAPKILSSLSMDDAFATLSLVAKQDPSFHTCHFIAHELAINEINRTGADWKDIATRCPVNGCLSGCLHGALLTKLLSENWAQGNLSSLKKELKTICEPREGWQPSRPAYDTCFHAIGHILMLLTKDDATTSANLCQELFSSQNDQLTACLHGTFMQLFSNYPEDEILAQGKRPEFVDISSFCKIFSGEANTVCFSKGWILSKGSIVDSQKIEDYCNQPAVYQSDHCLRSVERLTVINLNFNKEKVVSFCLGLVTSEILSCLSTVAQRFIEEDPSNKDHFKIASLICEESKSLDSSSSCFNDLISTAKYYFPVGSKPLFALCQNLPSLWRETCLKGSRGQGSQSQ